MRKGLEEWTPEGAPSVLSSNRESTSSELVHLGEDILSPGALRSIQSNTHTEWHFMIYRIFSQKASIAMTTL